MSVELSPVTIHTIDIPDDLFVPSGEDKVVDCFKNTICFGGGLALGIATIYLGVTTGMGPIPDTTLACGAGFFALKLIDWRCGRGSKTAEETEQNVKKIAQQLQQQKQTLTQERAAIDAMKTLNTKDERVVEAAAKINEVEAADTAKNEQTIKELKATLNHMTATKIELEAILKSSKEENEGLKQQIETYSTLLKQFHTQVKKAAETIPELEKIDLSWITAIHSIEGFNELSTQNKTLVEAIAQLKSTEYAALLDENSRLVSQIDELKKNNNHSQLIEALRKFNKNPTNEVPACPQFHL